MSDFKVDKELAAAVFKQDLKRVKAFLSAGANPNFVPNYPHQLHHQFGNKLLHYANTSKIARELLLHGALVDSTNMHTETPLHAAVQETFKAKNIGPDFVYVSIQRSSKLVGELLKHGANVNAANFKDNTPLHLALTASKRNRKIIKKLLEYGADINIKNSEFPIIRNSPVGSPLDIAMKHPDCAKLLIKYALLDGQEIDLTPYKTLGSYLQLSRYFDKCVYEIAQLKKRGNNSNLSLYDFIISKSASDIPVNDVLVKRIRGQVFQMPTRSNYPIYYDVISTKIGASFKRANLLNNLCDTEVFVNLDASNQAEGASVKTVVLDSYLKEEIAQYLSNKDLICFTAAFCRYTREFSCLKKYFTGSSTMLYEASTTSNCPKRARVE